MKESTVPPMSLILSNLPESHAQDLAKHLIQNHLAACVTLTPVQSIYRWDGKVCTDQEITLTAKVSEAILSQCVQAIRSLHPYDLPEILCLPVDRQQSYPPYLAWVAQECSSSDS